MIDFVFGNRTDEFDGWVGLYMPELMFPFSVQYSEQHAVELDIELAYRNIR